MLILNNYNITTKINTVFKDSMTQWKATTTLVNSKYTKYSINAVNPFKKERINLYFFRLKKRNIFTFNQFTFYFLKKEKLYTKLKYSRSPQYDIVSGGVAAIFSAFIGFLVSEKFGIELVDSGDFYVLFMYIVFSVFSIRPLIRIVSKFDKLTSMISIWPFIDLINQCFTLLLNKINVHFSRILG